MTVFFEISKFRLYSYFGRKRLLKKNENWVEGSDYLVYPSYSYWTLGYALSLDGAKKLLGMHNARIFFFNIQKIEAQHQFI